ncbi:MAG: HAMP domain-containing histidine kinase [Clostridia bacterium]|nr:HAMP domain-containing histidine kinase [Clostridia bacterium]
MSRIASLITGKIRAKIFLSVIAVIAVFICVISAISYPVLFRIFTKNTYEELCSVADTIDFLVPDSGSYYYDLYALSENHNVEFEIIDIGGVLLYKSNGEGSAMSSSHFAVNDFAPTQYSEMIPSVKHTKNYNYPNFEIKKKLATNADYFIYHSEISTGDTVYLYTPVADVENIVETADRVYSVFSILILGLSGLLFLFISSKFTKPVEEINDVTKDMAALNFERKCENYGKDEIGELGRSINILSNTLDSTLMDLKDKNAQLEKDIELRLALDNARKSFINNVSHELKTPIAIISGYAEALLEGISDNPQVIREYCGIINDESHKMNNLVLELLELSKLESKTSPFTPETFDIGESVAKIIDHLSIEFEKSGITVENSVPVPLDCYAQKDKIEIVINNYITNAISHCSGEKKITVSCAGAGECLRIEVFNTGEHIDEGDMAELWDSFYRADKAHGRSENRFGLGLSIVRSIMENHSCGYGVENADRGVKFYFDVPLKADYYENKSENQS